jgi:CRP-like cAMP-binding protein
VKRDVDDGDGGVSLGHLHSGAVFGELALVGDDPRPASVIAVGDVDVLELRRADLIVHGARSRTMQDAIKQFTRNRIVRNLMATHPLFSSLARHERKAVLARYELVHSNTNDILIEEEQLGPGLFVLLSGTATVSRRRGAERVLLGSLRPGDVCGEISLLFDQHTTATVTAHEPVESLFLSRSAFLSLLNEHPQLRSQLTLLSHDRQRRNRASMSAHDVDDGHVLV